LPPLVPMHCERAAAEREKEREIMSTRVAGLHERAECASGGGVQAGGFGPRAGTALTRGNGADHLTVGRPEHRVRQHRRDGGLLPYLLVH